MSGLHLQSTAMPPSASFPQRYALQRELERLLARVRTGTKRRALQALIARLGHRHDYDAVLEARATLVTAEAARGRVRARPRVPEAPPQAHRAGDAQEPRRVGRPALAVVADHQIPPAFRPDLFRAAIETIRSSPMIDVRTNPHLLVEWYATLVRPLLAEFAPSRAEELDRDIPVIEKAVVACSEQPAVCVLGHSGVGKSTLINAVVAGSRIILPQGGVGPLTAQATSVVYADESYFEVQYLGLSDLNRVRFALEKACDPSTTETAAVDPASDSPPTLGIEREDIDEADDNSTDEVQPGQTRRDRLAQRARLLIQGNQFGDADERYLVDGLRLALGNETRWGSAMTSDDLQRIERIRACLMLAKQDAPYRRAGHADDRAFLVELQSHASGFLAPLIRTLRVGWNSEVLREGLAIVDLPGLGIANDEYRQVTQHWVRNEARGIALIVDRGGLTHDSAELLRSSGFLARLLHAADDPAADPVQLLIVVVKLDQSADDSRSQEKALGTVRPWLEHFREACAKSAVLVRQQLRQQLDAFAVSSDHDVRQATQMVIDQVINDVRVFAVAAIEYRKLVEQDDTEPPKIRTAEDSNIPALVDAMREIAGERRRRLSDRVDRLVEEFADRLGTSLELLEAEWVSDERATEEVERLHQELEPELAKLRRELHSRQGAFYNFLRETLPTEIELLVDNAGQAAQRGMEDYLGELGQAHWATLKAAVRRGGTYMGARNVDLPHEFSMRFEESVAVIWSRKVLASIRKQTTALASFYAELVGKVVEWAEAQGSRVQPRLVRALHEEIKADMKRLERVGKDAVDELREKVKGSLFEIIERPIRTKSKRFVDQGLAQGTGVKRRILDLFREFVPEIVHAAKVPAKKILLENFREVEAEIKAVFDKYPDPLQAASDSILEGEAKRLRRSDARKRDDVLARLRAARAARPSTLPAPWIEEAASA
jgi:hypothetical protein